MTNSSTQKKILNFPKRDSTYTHTSYLVRGHVQPFPHPPVEPVRVGRPGNMSNRSIYKGIIPRKLGQKFLFDFPASLTITQSSYRVGNWETIISEARSSRLSRHDSLPCQLHHWTGYRHRTGSPSTEILYQLPRIYRCPAMEAAYTRKTRQAS